MRVIIKPHNFTGIIRVPASKSHTIRRLLIAAMAEGVSEIEYPLDSLDARSCVAICRALGATIEEYRSGSEQCPNPVDAQGKKLIRWVVHGIGAGNSAVPQTSLDVGNSGTTLFLALAVAALGKSQITFTGDEQIRRRSAGPLVDALAGLGIKVQSAENGCAPITVQGPWKGGRVTLPCPTSQYLSAILLAAPLAPAGTITEIDVPLLNERPYVELTLSYLKAQKIPYEAAEDFSYFRVPGGASYKPMNGSVPGDFSSAAFPGCAAAITRGPITLLGLDPADAQGDKAVFDMLSQMGTEISWVKTSGKAENAGPQPEWSLKVSRTAPLQSGTFDLNATPDLLPVMAVVAAYAQGETALINVAHARIKETDRIAVMAQELRKVGITSQERPDGLVIQGSRIQSGQADGQQDHRVVMALAVAALGAAGPIEIDGAEAADVTYPGFLELVTGSGKLS